MDGSIRATILRTLEIVARRHWLLITPLLVMLPVSVACAVLISGGYTARSLVMLQEQVASNPLAHENSEPSADRMAQTLKGLRALLASDYVLAPVVEGSSHQLLDPATRATRIKELAKNVSIDLLGNDFIEFRLAGGSAQGLGDRLQSIMTNLIGALLAPPGETAGQFALRSLAEKLRDAEAKAAALDARSSGLPPYGLSIALKQLAARQQLQARITEQLASWNATDKPGGSAAAATGGADERKALQDRLASLKSEIDDQNRQIAADRVVQAERNELADAIVKLRASLEDAKTKLGSEATTNWSAMINAPGRMIVVDPPKDPELRTTSRLSFVFTGAFGGVLLGIALVILAESFDTTLRTPEQLLAIAGVPCLGSLPRLSEGSRGPRSAVETAHIGVGRLLAPKGQLRIQQTRNDV